MEARELDPQTQVVSLARLRALQADFNKLASARDRLSAALIVSEMEVEELRDAMAALETVAARLGAQVRDLERQRDYALDKARMLRRSFPAHDVANIAANDILAYCESLTLAERARDAEERAGREAENPPDIDDPDLMTKVQEIPY